MPVRRRVCVCTDPLMSLGSAIRPHISHADPQTPHQCERAKRQAMRSLTQLVLTQAHVALEVCACMH